MFWQNRKFYLVQTFKQQQHMSYFIGLINQVQNDSFRGQNLCNRQIDDMRVTIK
jgi:hypothetical protein